MLDVKSRHDKAEKKAQRLRWRDKRAAATRNGSLMAGKKTHPFMAVR